MTFEKQVAVIIGASSGIGEAIAIQLARFGAIVGIVGRNLERVKETTNKIRTHTNHVYSYTADLAIDSDIDKLVNSLKGDFEHIDLLVHSAGAFYFGPIETTAVDQLDYLYRVNVRGPLILTQSLIPMLTSSKGQIVFINSSAGILSARANSSLYASTKHALKIIADGLRDELNEQGVRVLSVYPGRTATPLQARIFELEGKTYQPDLLMQPEDVAMTIMDALLIPRSAEVTDINIRPMIKSY
jgi:short-subunit dehydrogenase